MPKSAMMVRVGRAFSSSARGGTVIHHLPSRRATTSPGSNVVIVAGPYGPCLGRDAYEMDRPLLPNGLGRQLHNLTPILGPV
jgi:hypothetical protein